MYLAFLPEWELLREFASVSPRVSDLDFPDDYDYHNPFQIRKESRYASKSSG